MNKYNILIALNLPFVIFGLFKAYSLYKSGSVSRPAYTLRVTFWAAVAIGILFVQPVFNFLEDRSLTDSVPPSLLDVVEITGIVFCVTVCSRLYGKLEATEKRLNELHQRLSIELSTSASPEPEKRQSK